MANTRRNARGLLTTSGGRQVRGGLFSQREDVFELVTDAERLPSVGANQTARSRRTKQVRETYNNVVHHWALRERRRGGTYSASLQSAFSAAPTKNAVLGSVGSATLSAQPSAIENDP